MPKTLRRVGAVALPVLLGLVAAWFALAAFGSSSADMGPFRLRLDTQFGRGETDIALPPLGLLTADTHTSPMHIRATLMDVRIRELARTLNEQQLQELTATVEHDAVGALRAHVLRSIVVVALVALGLGALTFRRRAHDVITTLLAAVVALGASQILTIATFRTDAFRSPTFSGSLALATDVIPPVRTAEQIDAFQQQLSRVVNGAVKAYTSLTANPVGGEGEIRVLHVSDVHLAPFGFEFAQQIADGFDVDFIIDTGDTTSFGTTPENFVLSFIRSFDRPYVYVRGNHDAVAFQREVAKLPNAVVLDGGTTLLHGIRIYGMGHPVQAPDTREIDDDLFAAAALRAGERIVEDLAELDAPVDLVAVHDDRMAEAVAGQVPLVVSGHFHQAGTRVVNGTLFLRIGTTGGSALATFEPDEGIPLSAEVLYFEPGTPPRLIAWDVIEQSPKTGTLTVTRHLVEDEFGELTPSPSTSASPTPTGTASASG